MAPGRAVGTSGPLSLCQEDSWYARDYCVEGRQLQAGFRRDTGLAPFDIVPVCEAELLAYGGDTNNPYWETVPPHLRRRLGCRNRLSDEFSERFMLKPDLGLPEDGGR